MHNRIELRCNTFSQRIVQDWNRLSEATMSATTLNMFKTRLDNGWQAMKYIVYVTVISDKIGILDRHHLLSFVP